MQSFSTIRHTLLKISKEVTKAAIQRRKLQRMEEMKVGDFDVEVEAIRKIEESGIENLIDSVRD